MKPLTKCPGCGNKDVVAQDPMFCARCDKTPPADAVVHSGYYRRVNAFVAVTIDKKDLGVLFPELVRGGAL